MMMFWWPSAPALIEVAHLGDALELAELHAAAFHRGWSAAEIESLLAQDAVFGIVARRASPSEPATGRLRDDPRRRREAEVLTLAVSERQRRRGTGRR